MKHFVLFICLFWCCSVVDGQSLESDSTAAVVSHIEMPNAFSPNGDGYNETYGVKSSAGIVEFRATIFSRWGHKVYEWSGVDGGWDGTVNGGPAKEGTYFVLVRAKGADGVEHVIRKDVNLLRGVVNGEVRE